VNLRRELGDPSREIIGPCPDLVNVRREGSRFCREVGATPEEFGAAPEEAGATPEED
jgi:hypothetical protein